MSSLLVIIIIKTLAHIYFYVKRSIDVTFLVVLVGRSGFAGGTICTVHASR